jgi:hypothetical protein
LQFKRHGLERAAQKHGPQNAAQKLGAANAAPGWLSWFAIDDGH